ncbi:MAG TPA: hypothetical protein VFE47_03105 [Tepidisphaeraceae bacterium]|nr:hypothetical protein [Tepidisphaeraceae bacterium]
MTDTTSPAVFSSEFTPHKQELVLAFYRACCEEMSWRRTAGYRTVILGLAYCGLFLAVVGYIHPASGVRISLSAVIALASIFGAGYLVGNYQQYMSAAARAIKIEEYVGAFDADFLGKLGPLMPASRKTWPATPLQKDAVSLWSVIALAVGGLGTAVAVFLM